MRIRTQHVFCRLLLVASAAKKGLAFGHENMGIVEELSSGVTLLKRCDRIVLAFNVADGRCQNCEEGKTAFCTGVNPGLPVVPMVMWPWVHIKVVRHSI